MYAIIIDDQVQQRKFYYKVDCRTHLLLMGFLPDDENPEDYYRSFPPSKAIIAAVSEDVEDDE